MPRDPTWTEWWHSPAEKTSMMTSMMTSKYDDKQVWWQTSMLTNKYDDKQAWWHSSEEKRYGDSLQQCHAMLLNAMQFCTTSTMQLIL